MPAPGLRRRILLDANHVVGDLLGTADYHSVTDAARTTHELSTPVVIPETQVLAVTTTPDVVIEAAGHIHNETGSIDSIVALLENGVEIGRTTLNAPNANTVVPFSLHKQRTGPLVLGTEGYLNLPGTTSDYAYCADSANFDGADLDIWVLCAATDWTSGANQALIAKYETTGGNQSWDARITATGAPNLVMSAAGNDGGTSLSGIELNLTDGTRYWLRWQRTASTGLVTFSTADGTISPDNITSADFDVRATPQVVLAGQSPYSSTAVVTVGGQDGTPGSAGAQPFAGKVYAARIYVNNVEVANPDWRGGVSGDTTHTDSHGNVWALNGSASIHAAIPAYSLGLLAGTGALHTTQADGYLNLPGGTSDYAYTPDSAVFDGADLEIQILAAATDWTPAALSTLAAKFETTGNQKSWIVSITTTGLIQMVVSADGSNSANNINSSAPSLTDGTAYWLRQKRVAATGVVTTGKAASTLAAPQESDWTAITTAGTLLAGSSPFSSSAVVTVGGRDGIPTGAGTNPFTGKIMAARILVNGTEVANPDWRHTTGGGSTVTDGHGLVWTKNGSSSIVAEILESSVGRVILDDATLTVRSTQRTTHASSRGGGTYGTGLDWIAPGGLNRTRAAFLTGTADIVTIGDSITEGSGATTDANRWARKLVDNNLRSLYQPIGITGGRGFEIPWHTGGTAAFDPWTNSGGTQLIDTGLALKAYQLDSSGDQMSATFIGTRIDVFWRRTTTGGTVNVTIDGGAPTSINCNGVDTPGQHTSFSGLSDAAHTIVIAWVSGTDIIEGVFVYRGDEASGIRLWSGGHGGWTAVAEGKDADWAQTLLAIPNLSTVIIELGINDRTANTTPAVVVASLEAIVTTIRARVTADIVVWNMWQSSTAATYPWTDYETIIKEWIHTDGTINFFDGRARIGDSPSALQADGLHPNDTGHTLLASELSAFLVG
jgi:lysophospholipase L1-like esterase